MLEKDTRQAFKFKLMTVKSNVLLVYKRKISKEIGHFVYCHLHFIWIILTSGLGWLLKRVIDEKIVQKTIGYTQIRTREPLKRKTLMAN